MHLINKSHNDFYKENGYLHLPFLENNQLDEIDKILKKYLLLTDQFDFIFSSQLLNKNDLYKMNDEINIVIQPSIDKLINNYEILFSVIASKNTSNNTKVKFHTDRCYIDESRHTPFNLWIPLCDLNEDNGSFGIFPTSHHFTHTWRGVNNSEYYMAPDIIKYIEDNCIEYVNAKRGDLIIYQPGLIHGSLENRSGKIRHAIITTLMPPSGELIYCYQNQHWSNFKKKIDVYSVPKDFWIQSIQPSPKGKFPLLKQVRNNKPKIYLSELTTSERISLKF